MPSKCLPSLLCHSSRLGSQPFIHLPGAGEAGVTAVAAACAPLVSQLFSISAPKIPHIFPKSQKPS